MADFTPSTVPGCRVPHIWLSDGRSLYDALGSDYTLLRLDSSINAEPLLRSAGNRRVPLSLLDVSPREAGADYDRALVLARPDQHVAWRGNELPQDTLALVDLIRGAIDSQEVEGLAPALASACWRKVPGLGRNER
jgi:hypothetical protein